MNTEGKKDQSFIRIELTPSQQAQVVESTGKQAEAIELTAAELEARIAPLRYSGD